jgi:hypothetical protein
METGQPYAYTGDDPVNAVDPLGLAAGHLSATAVCSDEHARDMSSCISTETKREERGPFDAYDTCELGSSRPEAFGLFLGIATGGLGDLIEALGGAAATGDESVVAASGRDALGRFTGTGGYGASAEAQGLNDYATATGRTVISDQVRATLPDGSIRYYDGLSPNGDGTYEGVEVKSGSASLSASQRAFDAQVDSGGPATATLNGQQIEITSTRLVRVR